MRMVGALLAAGCLRALSLPGPEPYLASEQVDDLEGMLDHSLD